MSLLSAVLVFAWEREDAGGGSTERRVRARSTHRLGHDSYRYVRPVVAASPLIPLSVHSSRKEGGGVKLTMGKGEEKRSGVSCRGKESTVEV